MATLKDDDSSWKAHGLKKKIRDWENDPKPRVVQNKKKNTHKWCKGKVGVEHDVRNVLIVSLNPMCAKNGSRDKDGKIIRCGHWRHYENKCVNCGKSSYRVAKASRPAYKQQRELEEKWCTEGHLWDWVTIEYSWGKSGREIQTCLMCGKTKGKSRRQME